MAQAFLNGVSYDQSNMNVAQLIERTVTELEIPEGVTKIGHYAFYECRKMASVTIPDSVLEIGYYAFHGCSALQSIALPPKITTIETSLLYGCSKITRLEIPAGVNLIKASALRCDNCLEFDFSNHSAVPIMENKNTMSQIKANAKILVPASLYEEWISATNWSQYADYIQPVVDIPKMEIPDHVSEGLQIVGSSVMGRGSCTDSIIVINEGEKVEYIGMDAFWEDQDIEELYVLGSIVSIDNGVCSRSSLKRLYMENVSSIWSITLNADALEYVRFSKNISYIGEASLQSKNANVIYDFSAFEGDEIPALYFYTSGDSLTSGVILVPSSRCEEWKTATNWSYYADKIFPV